MRWSQERLSTSSGVVLFAIKRWATNELRKMYGVRITGVFVSKQLPHTIKAPHTPYYGRPHGRVGLITTGTPALGPLTNS